jgi:hypothetical protein
MSDEFLIPGGSEKGTPVSQASRKTLEYWVTRIGTALAEGTSRNPQRDQKGLAEMKAALAVGGGGARNTERARPPRNDGGGASTSIARISPAQLAEVSGQFDVPATINQVFERCKSLGHLLTPQSMVGELPLGCAVSVSPLTFDVEKHAYSVGSDKFMLTKVALRRIASALDMDWVESCRTDDRSDPHYCAWRVTALVRGFDTSQRRVVGSVDLDARDGSTYASETAKRASENQKQSNNELAMTRKFLTRHCESKAMNRAIRDAAASGLDMYLTRADLAKPFFAVRLMFTGKCPDNPDIERLFAARIYDSFHNASAMVYPSARTEQALGRGAGHAPPALASGEHEHDEHEDGYPDDANDANDDWGMTDDDDTTSDAER